MSMEALAPVKVFTHIPTSWEACLMVCRYVLCLISSVHERSRVLILFIAHAMGKVRLEVLL